MVAEKYQGICSIGKGACGDVFLVRNTETQKCYALKKVELDESRKTRRKESVLREARIMAELRHPHIVMYYESFFDIDEKHLCIVLDYCDGGTLDDKVRETLQAGVLFKEKQIIQWFLQIAMAVRYLHFNKILHRDLKTENVFLNKSGTICKLGDFGIAKSIDKTVEVSSTCVGTPCYLSPEMCQDIPYTSKADVWALGCILYELCALKPAFDAHNLVSLFYKIVKAEYEPIPDEFSDNLLNVLEALMTKEPEDRPSAQEVLAMPFLKKQLLTYIEENEFKLQQVRLPTRQGPRPYTTPAKRDTAHDTLSPLTLPNDLDTSKVKRAVSCRPNILHMNQMASRSRQTVSAKPGERVATIEEESDDQVSGTSRDNVEKPTSTSHNCISTSKAKDSPEQEPIAAEETAQEEKEGPLHMHQKKTDRVPDDESNITSIPARERDILRSVKGMSKTPEPVRRIILEDKLRSRSLTPDSAKSSRRFPRELTRGKENRKLGLLLEFDKPYTNLMDGMDLDAAPSSPRRLNLDLSNRFTPVSRLQLYDNKLPHLVSSLPLNDSIKESELSHRKKAIQEPQRTPRVPIKLALQVEIEKEISQDEGPLSPKQTVDSKSAESVPKRPKHDTIPKPKEKEPEAKPAKATEQEPKQRLKLPKLKQKQSELKQTEPQMKKESKSKKPGNKDSKGTSKKASDQSKQEKRQAKIERQTTREGTEIYYSDDFDEDSEIEEDIPEEISTGRDRSSSTTSHLLDSADIPEDLPDGEEATDLDSSTRELDAAVTVAREVHDCLTEAEDELVVDTSVRQPSALIRKHCIKQLGAEKFEKVSNICNNEASESDIRELETSLGKEQMNTFYLMNALMQTKK